MADPVLPVGESGKKRCHRCLQILPPGSNRGTGLLKDGAAIVRFALKYLEERGE